MNTWTGIAAAVDEYTVRLDAATSAGQHAASIHSTYDSTYAVYLL